jgi:phospholipid-binding lipoprotein MlaA
MHANEKNRYWKRIGMVALVMVMLVTGGTTALAQEDSEARKLTDPDDPLYEHPIDNYDPWEGFNRSMYKFNYGVDKYFFIPVVKAYRFILPDVARTGIANFFSNLFEVTNVMNNLLQGDAEGTVNTTFRFVFNSTIGLGGLMDPATPMGFTRDNEDFGQTLGVWGAGPGPYLVLPVLGPSTVRDGIGTGVDSFVGSLWLEALVNSAFNDTGDRDKVYYGLTALRTISTRDQVPFRYYETGSPFEYEYMRFIYLKGRQVLIEK